MDGQGESSDTGNINQRFYLISGIYHPKPEETEKIDPSVRWDVLDRNRLEEINKQLKGKAITVNHPFDTNGIPILIDEYGSNYRGKVVHSRILDDGRGFFIAKIPINNSVKSKLFKKMLKDKTFSELSMTHEFVGNLDTGEGNYIPNHIALLKENEARRPGCKILEILKMPKKRHGNIKSGVNDLNLFKQLKKNKIVEKQNRFLSIASVLGNQMNQQQAAASSSQVQDDAAVAAPDAPVEEAVEPAPEIIAEIVNNPSEWSRNDMAQVMVRNLQELKQKEQMLEEMSRKLAEFEKTQQEARKKQIESLRDEVTDTWSLVANVEYDPEAPPLTDEAKKKNANTIKEIIEKASSIDDPDPIVRKEKIIKEFDNLARAISVASKEGAAKISEQTKMMREGSASFFNPSKVSSFNSRFAYSKTKRQRGDDSNITESSSSAAHEKKVVDTTLDELRALREGKISLYNSRNSNIDNIYDKGRQLLEGSYHFKKAMLTSEPSPFAPRTTKNSTSAML